MKLDYSVKCTNDECDWDGNSSDCKGLDNRNCPKCNSIVKEQTEKEAIPWRKQGLWIEPDTLLESSCIIIWAQRIDIKTGSFMPWTEIACMPISEEALKIIKKSAVAGTYITCERPWRDHWGICHHEWVETKQDVFKCTKCGVFCEDAIVVKKIKEYLE